MISTEKIGLIRFNIDPPVSDSVNRYSSLVGIDYKLMSKHKIIFRLFVTILCTSRSGDKFPNFNKSKSHNLGGERSIEI